MTTTVIVRIDGNYRATVKQDDKLPVVIEGDYTGRQGEHVFQLPSTGHSTFEITEVVVADGDQ